jgi:ribose transport system substrate-binding protein
MKKSIVLILAMLLTISMAFPLYSQGTKEVAVDTSQYVYETKGPNGEAPTDYSNVVLSDAEKATVKQAGYKVAILMHESSDWVNAVIAGARSMSRELNMNVVAVTDAGQDPNKQRTDIETTLALDPDIIITLVLDPVSGSVALKQAIDKGVNVVLISNLPSNFTHGKDYAGIVTDDLFQMGKSVADMIGTYLNGEGEVALMFHDANYYVTNQRDQAVEAVLRRDYPGIKIVAKRGIVNANDSETLASAILTQYPGVDAIYAPWDVLAEGVVAAARTAGNKDVGVFTIDLGANNVMDMVKGGNMKGVVADLPFVLGETLVKMGALSMLGKETPAFVTVPAISITKENIAKAWKQSLNRDLPPEIAKALK